MIHRLLTKNMRNGSIVRNAVKAPTKYMDVFSTSVSDENSRLILGYTTFLTLLE